MTDLTTAEAELADSLASLYLLCERHPDGPAVGRILALRAWKALAEQRGAISLDLAAVFDKIDRGTA